MAKKDLAHKYLDSYLGIVWAFLQPLVTVLVLWFVFIVGFRVGKTDSGFPFILWLVVGMVPWTFFSDAISNGTSSITSYSYLVKKVVFRIESLPLIKIFSSLFVHAILVIVLLIMAFSFGTLSFYAIQILYYLFCAIVLLFGISLITSSLNVFTSDVSQIINVIMQIGFWATPVFWNVDKVPKEYLFILKLNPIYYIIQGYRDSLLFKIYFWERPLWAISFWITAFVLLFLGILIFTKTKPHFADVL